MSLTRLVAALCALLAALPALAHPYGAAHFGHLVRLTVDEGEVRVEYRAEVPTNRVIREISAFHWDTRGDEGADFTGAKLDELAGGLTLEIDAVEVVPERVAVERTGVGNSQFFLYDVVLRAELEPGRHEVRLVNDNYEGESAFYSSEVVVSDAWAVVDCSLLELEGGVVLRDRSRLWSRDESLRRLSVDVEPSGGVAGLLRSVGGGEPELRGASEAVAVDPLVALVHGELSFAMVLIALGLSLFFGAAHALSPGHGKALVAGYLVGSRGTVGQAVLLGLVVTASHVVSVVVLGVVTLVLAERFAPEAVYPWIELSSGLLVVGLGAVMIVQRAPLLRRNAPLHHDHHDHHDHHHHHHDHHHHHHDHPPRSHALAHLLGRPHHHAPAPDDVGPWALLSLGVSGGMVPCPTALVVLLTAVSLHRVALGLAMVGAFSLGLAVVLVAIAVGVVLLGDRLKGRGGGGRLVALLPMGSALLVTALGVFITIRSVAGW